MSVVAKVVVLALGPAESPLVTLRRNRLDKWEGFDGVGVVICEWQEYVTSFEGRTLMSK